jgi:hypothetical protein
MSAQDSIWISKLHPIMDLSSIIRACGTPQYFGQLDSNEPGDEVLIQGLKHHMTNQALVGCCFYFLFSSLVEHQVCI